MRKILRTATVQVAADRQTAFAATREALTETLRLVRLDADEDTGVLTAAVKASIASFGEWVTATLTPSDSAVTVELASRPRIPTTLIDYGKNRRNVERVAARLRERLDADPPPT